MKVLEEERETEKNKWLSFNSKVSLGPGFDKLYTYNRENYR